LRNCDAGLKVFISSQKKISKQENSPNDHNYEFSKCHKWLSE